MLQYTSHKRSRLGISRALEIADAYSVVYQVQTGPGHPYIPVDQHGDRM